MPSSAAPLSPDVARGVRAACSKSGCTVCYQLGLCSKGKGGACRQLAVSAQFSGVQIDVQRFKLVGMTITLERR